MLTRTLPEIGYWYENRETGGIFEVISIDDGGLIATQYYDGELEEIDTETFLKLPLKVTEQSEDWSGPYEVDSEDRFESDFFNPLEDNDQDPAVESSYMRLVE